ncbi:CRISPR-associated protein Cmr3 [Solimonas aquatica]|uniref:CRISPR-associated protein Cmr3 n=1 Tax=Solimonas aquatica TaxID=489703 RepID=A0A1H9M8K7_9GAMM|nr:type III-B CRISPR module-associated Cmr3 family protein [Solimonas aquatica]SER20110.1 CRISPR-associated protein Cmr3 [Solimonas aquatica]
MSRQIDVPFLVEPCEPVSFGPPKSASAGEAHRIGTQFPPSPQTFQGLVRSRLLHGAEPALDFNGPRAKSEIAQLVGTPQELPRGWQLTGPFPAQRIRPSTNDADSLPFIRPWLPTPQYILKAAAGALHAREVISTHAALSDLHSATPGPALGRPEAGAMEPRGGWIGPDNLRFALGGEGKYSWNNGQWRADQPPFVSREHQPGLAIDRDSASAQHGMLYFVEALRFEYDSGLFGQLRASLDDRLQAQALTQGAGQAGRKGRLVAFGPAEHLDPTWHSILRGEHLPQRVDDGACFWLVAITPALIDNPLQPEHHALLKDGMRLDFLAALTGRSFAVGGFELATGRPRDNRAYLPAGSAWLIRLHGGSAEGRRDALFNLHNRHALGPEREAAMGFGHCLVGIGPLTKMERS